MTEARPLCNAVLPLSHHGVYRSFWRFQTAGLQQLSCIGMLRVSKNRMRIPLLHHFAILDHNHVVRQRIREQAEREGRSVDEVYAAFAARQPMGRIGTAEEIAQLALYLGSSASIPRSICNSLWLTGHKPFVGFRITAMIW